jgi:hypothetical protein
MVRSVGLNHTRLTAKPGSNGKHSKAHQVADCRDWTKHFVHRSDSRLAILPIVVQGILPQFDSACMIQNSRRLHWTCLEPSTTAARTPLERHTRWGVLVLIVQHLVGFGFQT